MYGTERGALTEEKRKRTVHLYSYPVREMANVNVTDLRQNLPAYLERARRGELIRVVSRGTVIAEITAPKAAEEEAELIRERLRGTVVEYESPTEPACPPEDWSANQ